MIICSGKKIYLAEDLGNCCCCCKTYSGGVGDVVKLIYNGTNLLTSVQPYSPMAKPMMVVIIGQVL